MSRRTVFPARVYDPHQMIWFTGSVPLTTFTGIRAVPLPFAYNVHRMDLYIWSAANTTPDKAYYGSYFNNSYEGQSFVNADGTLKEYIEWSTVTGDGTTIPVVYYIDTSGNVVHAAYGGLVGTGYSGGVSAVIAPPPEDTSGGSATTGGGGSGCFALSTPALLDGSAKLLGYLKPDDQIVGVAEDNKVKTSTVQATKFHKGNPRGERCLTLVFEKPFKTELVSTLNHLILTEDGYIPAMKLVPGKSKVISTLYGACTLVQAIPTLYKKAIGTLQTSTHNFALTELGLIVHNMKCMDCFEDLDTRSVVGGTNYFGL